MNAPLLLLLLLLLLLPGVLDEKASACEALGIYAAESGVAFMPYVEKAVEAVEAMSMFFVEDVRQVAYTAMGGMVKAVALAFPPAGPGQTTPQVRFLPLSVSVCLNCLSVCLNCLSLCLYQLSACLPACLPIWRSLCLSACLFCRVCSVCSDSQPILPSLCPSICCSVNSSTQLSLT